MKDKKKFLTFDTILIGFGLWINHQVGKWTRRKEEGHCEPVPCIVD